MSEPTRFCGKWFLGGSEYIEKCGHKNAAHTNLVTGVTSVDFCRDLRHERSKCGEKGAWWEPKE